MDFLQYYRDNLMHLRELSAEFALEYPKIAHRLDVNNLAYRDPLVERLLEGTAFLAARVEKKLDESQLNFVEALLTSCAPQLLTLLPSYSLIWVNPNSIDSAVLARPLETGSRFTYSPQPNDLIRKACVFSTLYTSYVSKVVVSDVLYQVKSLERFNPMLPSASSALSMKLSLPAHALGAEAVADQLPYLDLFINLEDEMASMLVGLGDANLESVYIEYGQSKGQGQGLIERLSGVYLSSAYFDSETGTKPNLLQQSAKSGQGMCDVQAYLNYSSAFKVLRIKGFKSVVSRIAKLTSTGEARLYFVFNTKLDSLVHAIKPDTLKTNCVPVLNLFSKRTSRLEIGFEHRCRLNVDNAALSDYEIFSVEHIDVYDSSNQKLFTAYPFYKRYFSQNPDFEVGAGQSSNKLGAQSLGDINFFSTHYQERLTNPDRNVRFSRKLVDIYVTLSGSDFIKQRPRINNICATVQCTNGYKVKAIAAGSILSNSDDLSATMLFTPIGPEQSIIARQCSMGQEQFVSEAELQARMQENEASHAANAQSTALNTGTVYPRALKLYAYVLNNLATFMWQSKTVNQEYLCNLIRLLSLKSEVETQRLVDGIELFKVTPQVFRFIQNGCIYFENGFNVYLLLNDSKLYGVGVYFLAQAMYSITKSMRAFNTPMRFSLYTTSRGLVKQWLM